MGTISIVQVVIPGVVLVLLCICSTGASNSTVGCRKDERNALLEFKHGVIDHRNRLSSWVAEKEEDCCKWEGVACNNRTGHVVRLDLRNPHPYYNLGDGFITFDSSWGLGGEISSSLIGLRHLNYLDLRFNNFGGIPIPQFMGSFQSLRYLNLYSAGFAGPIPPSLGNLSNLQYLSLADDLSMDDAHWLSRLSSLRHLLMLDVVIGKATNWLQALNMLPSLVEVRLSFCELLGTIPSSLPHLNFTSLSTLDLSDNHINSTIPDWLFNLTGLEYLDLSDNSFHGLLIPAAFGNLTSLRVLDLSGNSLLITGGIPRTMGNLCKLQRLGLGALNIAEDITELGEIFSGCMNNSLEALELGDNQLSGYLPDWLGNLPNLKSLGLSGNLLYGPISDQFLGRLSSSLQVLDFSNNKLNGTIPESLGFLSELTRLDLSSNLLVGDISEAHFAHLAKLEVLDLSSNSLVLKFRPDWSPPFQLISLRLSSFKLGPQFPTWLRMQKNVWVLELSDTGIMGALPDWFWNSSSHIISLDLSNNRLKGKLPNSLSWNDLESLNLSSNYFEGPLPFFPPSVTLLDLSKNSFSGPVHPSFGKTMPHLSFLLLSTNNLNGKIPLSVCEIEDLEVLNLSQNQLSEELPNCWNRSSRIMVMDFAGNNLSGGIPKSIGFLSYLESLHLSNNNLSGELPLSLKNFKRLITLDLGHNKFTGSIPTWIGENLLPLKILRLRSNMFHGHIPPNLPRLLSLQFLDLACNNLSGTIPSSFGNFLSMKIAQGTIGNVLNSTITTGYNKESIVVTIRGSEEVYDRLLSLVILIDLSGNSLSGVIPQELSSLLGLQSLNLSENHLTGEITEKISELSHLERLDLSRNHLSGAIPSSMSALTFLSFLNLSYNNLSGRIPSGNQFQTFIDPSIYIGNPGLCGAPLTEKCEHDESNHVPAAVQGDGENEDEDGSEIAWFYMSIAPGFVVGLWAVFGVLIFKRSWRYAYFRFTDKMYDCIYVAIVVNWGRIKNIV